MSKQNKKGTPWRLAQTKEQTEVFGVPQWLLDGLGLNEIGKIHGIIVNARNDGFMEVTLRYTTVKGFND
jgi:hypothetical protein